jgi:alpha-galactosidase/6-phospho-beta-glucosidase family protein
VAGTALSNDAEYDAAPLFVANRHSERVAPDAYHRIALDVMNGLLSDGPREIVLNVKNRGAIGDLEADRCRRSAARCLQEEPGPVAPAICRNRFAD